MSYWGSHYSLLHKENEEAGREIEDDPEKELRESLSLNKAQMEELKECFKLCDKSGKGYVTPMEFNALAKSVGQGIDNDDLRDLFAEIDQDGDGRIDFIEFLQIMHSRIKQPITDEDIQQCFTVFDEDENGFLTVNGLKRVFLSLGQQRTFEELNEMMHFIDVSNDEGLITFEAFKNYLIKEDLLRRDMTSDEDELMQRIYKEPSSGEESERK